MKTSILFAAAGALALSACLSACSGRASDEASAPSPAANDATATYTSVPPSPTPSPTSAAPAAKPGRTLALEGLGDLVIGQKIPAASSFKPKGAQASDRCLTYSSPDYPGVYAMVEGGTLRRITVGSASDVKLAEGVGVGSTEKQVLAAFPGFRSEPHKYVAAPGKYLTQPGNDPRLRFEIGADGKVTDIHVGSKPQLLYVEGCA